MMIYNSMIQIQFSQICFSRRYSSSEYLLCGLPVVSTESQGGRDYWFDDYNSIICEPNENLVKKSVEIMLEKLDNGEIDREKIRNMQIEKMNLMRENIIKVILPKRMFGERLDSALSTMLPNFLLQHQLLLQHLAYQATTFFRHCATRLKLSLAYQRQTF